MTNKQKQIIFDLLKDNLSIYNEIAEVENGVLCNDEEFTSKCKAVIDYCYNLYMNTIKNAMNMQTACFLMKVILNELYIIREDYWEYSWGYKFMNSFYDKTTEAYEELMNS